MRLQIRGERCLPVCPSVVRHTALGALGGGEAVGEWQVGKAHQGNAGTLRQLGGMGCLGRGLAMCLVLVQVRTAE